MAFSNLFVNVLLGFFPLMSVTFNVTVHAVLVLRIISTATPLESNVSVRSYNIAAASAVETFNQVSVHSQAFHA
jgi:hypothetical protein